MNFIFKHENWFLSDDGKDTFNKVANLEERIAFLYSYLRAICEDSKKEYDDIILFKLAFLLADGVLGANLSYSRLPDFLDSKTNPFIAFVKNSETLTAKDNIYISLLSITHEIANPFVKSDWIFNESMMREDKLKEQLENLEHDFIGESNFLPNPECFNIDKAKEFIQLQIIWLFAQTQG